MTARKSLDQLPLQPASEDIWDKKYRLKTKSGEPIDKDVDATYKRVARALADIEAPEKREKYYKKFLKALRQGAIPAGRITSNAGAQEYKPETSLINCTVSGSINDNMDDIMRKAHEAALTLKAGCVAPGTLVVTEHGLVTADKAVAEKHSQILSYDRDKRVFEMRSIEEHMVTHVPRKNNIRIKAAKTELTTSNQHPVLVYRNGILEYVRADSVKVGDAMVQKCFPWTADNSKASEAWFAGAHLGDGSAYRRRPVNYSESRSAWRKRAKEMGERLVFKIRAAEREVVDRYAQFFREFCGARAQVLSSATPGGTPVWDYAVSSYGASKAIGLVDDIVGPKCHSLRVPSWIAQNPEKYFLPFLAGLLDTDGTVSCDRGAASLFTANVDFANQIKGLLALFGVHGGITVVGPRAHQFNGNNINGSGGAILKISDSSFLSVVARYMVATRKKIRIADHASTSGQYETFVMTPELRKALSEEKSNLSHIERQHLGFYHGYHKKNVISRVWLDRWESKFPQLAPMISFVKTLRPVVSIETNLDLPETFFDFRVEKNNNYLAGNNGLLVIHNCGIGYSFSTLRPRGAFVAGAGAYTSGPLSFMDIYDKTCFTVASAGGRRGAQMGTFDVSHPDVRDFIRAKRTDGFLRQFNLSLLITDEFVEAVESNQDWALVFPVHPKEVDELDLEDASQVVWRDWPVKDGYVVREDGLVACKIYEKVPARRLWDMIMASTYDYAEPGFILIDRVNEMNNNWWCEDIQATNPCVMGDTLVLTDQGEKRIDSLVGQQVNVWNGQEFSKVEVRITGEDQEIVQLTFSNGSVLECTLYHGFHLADGRKVEARELQMGDVLETFAMPNGQTHKAVRVVSTERLPERAAKVYCFTEPLRNRGCFNGVVTANCGEQPLPPYGSCLLGSVNLTRFVRNPFTEEAYFDWKAYRENVRVFTRLLDNVVEINGLPLEKQQQEIYSKRRHGMGFLGLGSTLTMLQIPYGSPKSVEFTEEVTKVMAVEGWKEGLELAKEKGPAPLLAQEFTVDAQMLRKRPEMVRDGWKVGDTIRGSVLHARYSRYMQKIAEVEPELVKELEEVGARFTHHTSIAPTGTISLSLANNVSNGIEPSFAHHYSRNIIREGRKTKEKVEVYSYELLAYRHLVNPQAMPFSEDEAARLPDYFVSADDVSPTQHVDIQAAAQKWVDSSISKTANVPTDFPYEKFKDIYLYAYHKGLKGCTTFRFNPEAFQGVLVKEKDLENTVYEFTLEDGTVVSFKGNETVEYDGEEHTAANLFDALKEGYYGKF